MYLKLRADGSVDRRMGVRADLAVYGCSSPVAHGSDTPARTP